jgi:hypothetical protein
MKTPEEILAAFAVANDKMQQLRHDRRRQDDGQILEAAIRLSQAEYFLREFRNLEKRAADGDESWTRISASVQSDAVKAVAEAFYYFAGRAWKALGRVTGVDLRFDPEGVRNVRNHMIEHPEGDDGLRVTWWMYDTPEGFVLAPGNPVGQKGWTDRGLYPNAQEFVEKLMPKLERALPSAGT